MASWIRTFGSAGPEETGSERKLREEFREQLKRVTPRTWATFLLIAANVAVFAAMVASGTGVLDPDLSAMLPWGINYGPLTLTGQWWRLFASNFIHFGIVHLVLNMAALLVFGTLSERIFGPGFFLLVYSFAGLTASLGSLLWDQGVASAGASGAIFGALGAVLSFLLLERGSLQSFVIRDLRSMALQAIAYTILYSTLGTVDHAGHVGGLAGGFLLGLFLARPLGPKRHERDWQRLLVGLPVACLAGAALASVIPNEYLRYEENLRWLDRENAEISAAFKDIMEHARAGGLSEAQLLDRLERSCVARSKAVAERFDGMSDRLKEIDPMVFELVRLRHDYFRLYVEYLRTTDPAREQQIAADLKANKAVQSELIEKRSEGGDSAEPR